jgi:UDP-N-acetylmuramyl pentapeptide phosphotransferase/UDP-N-acetylglucosamine-1-phosphate transferase
MHAKLLHERTLPAFAAALIAAEAMIVLTGRIGLMAFVISLVLLLAGRPLFEAYAMARPNARSSHRTPVPQGAGGPVIIATLLGLLAQVLLVSGTEGLTLQIGGIVLGALLLAVTGGVDDIRGLPVLPRLVAQGVAVACIVLLAPQEWRIFGDAMPLVVERGLLVIAGIWFVNLTNFIDGIDGITLAGFMPLALGAFLLADARAISPAGAWLAASFLAAQAAFVFFNWHPARLFLGDLGSLPIGLIGGALLYDIAAHGAVAAAVILPLYHFLDATLTLALRIARRERVWEAHRQHAYQRAVDGGWSHMRVSGLVLVLNLALAGLAWFSAGLTVLGQSACVMLAVLMAGGMIVLFRRTGQPA